MRTSSLRILASSALPGLLAGTQITGLLFFLNPHLPFEPVTVLRGVAFYGGLLAALSALLLLPAMWRSPERTGRLLPLALTAVLALAAISAWFHASEFAFFLPPGINRRLLKAAIWLSLGAIICFYTALLHLVRSRPYGRRSLTLFLLVSLASVYVVMERREAFKPEPGPGPRATTIEGSQRPNLVVVGIESATLDAILPLAEQGLPFFARLVEESHFGRLAPIQPSRRLPLWTSLATGKYPYQHGIVGERVYSSAFLGCEEPLFLLPMGVAFREWGACRDSRPTQSEDRQVLSLWEILSRLGVPTGVIGWPLTTNAKPEVEVLISDSFFEDETSEAIFPFGMEERARLFRSTPDEIDPRLLAPFGPEPPAVVLDALVQDLWRQELSFFLLDQQPDLDALFVFLPGLAQVSEVYFAGYASAQFEGSQDSSALVAAQLSSAYYFHLDRYLARLWDAIKEPKLMAVVSVQGSDSRQGLHGLWQRIFPSPATEASFESSPDGVLMLMGSEFQASQRTTAQLVDIAPTLLYAVGAPLARDLDGAVLTDAFTPSFLGRRPLSFIPSYEALSSPKP